MQIKKILLIGIIILLISSSILPVITAANNDIENVYSETVKIPEKRTSNNYEEIVTFIRGRVDLNWIERRGFFRGEALLVCRYQSGLINLSGYRRSESGIEYYNELIEKGLVYVNHLVCFYIDYSYFMIDPKINGIAFGNIVWEEYE
jgi:hypothetical protein